MPLSQPQSVPVGVDNMFGFRRHHPETEAANEQLRQARGRLAEGVVRLDRVLSDEPIQAMVRKALKKVEDANRAPPAH